MDIRIYWINTPFRKDRREHIMNELKNIKYKDIRISSVYHSDPGISCLLSHFEAIKTAHFDDCDYAIILEDDACLIEQMIHSKMFNNIINGNYNYLEWDVIQLHSECPVYMSELLKNDQIKQGLIKGYLMSCSCYIYNKKGINKFLDIMGKKERNDILLNVNILLNAKAEEFVYRYVNSYTTVYPLCNTIDSESDLSKDEKYLSNHKTNSKLIDLLLRKNIEITDFVFNFPYHTHYFNNKEEFNDVFKDYPK